MQGGRSESAVLGSWAKFPFPSSTSQHDGDGDTSGYESEVTVGEDISLGKSLDVVLHSLRVAFAVSISLPIAWMCLHPSIAEFRSNKLRVVQHGTKQVVWLQSKFRNRFFDAYFQVFSFCAEEEFYLLLLPFVIWNVDRVFGRRLTLLVCIGLLAGNLMKDVFQLPRPKSSSVWRPSHQETVDSTALQDFGFPSTHSMNAVTNSLYAVLYRHASPQNPMLLFSPLQNDASVRLELRLAALYIISLSFSRLYLGAHTPTDIRGGLALGATWLAFFFPWSEAFDEWYMTTSNLGLKLLGLSIAFLLLNPQPRPPTPTFLQNSLLVGLISGCMLGARHFNDLEKPDLSKFLNLTDWRQQNEVLAIIFRTILGYVIVLILRIVAKTMMVSFLHMGGIEVSPNVISEERKKKVKIVHLFTRDIDIVGSSIVKVVVYTVLAWSITFLVPMLLGSVGLLSF